MRRRGETLIPPVCPAYRRQPISGHSNKSPRAAESSNFPSFPVDNEHPLAEAALRSEVEKKWKSASKYSLFLHKIRYFPYSTFIAFKIEWQYFRGM
jgi:hypothetical protein